MERYCSGWSESDGLCTPQLIQLVGNIYVVIMTITFLYYINVTQKHLVRFLYHNVHYGCIIIVNTYCVIFEVIAWHHLYGATEYIVLNSLFQILGVVASGVLYAGGERIANKALLLILAVHYLVMCLANVLEVVEFISHFVGSVADIDVRLVTSAARSLMFLIVFCISLINYIRGKGYWHKVADTSETVSRHWSAALPSKFTYSWMTGLLIKGWRTPLEMSDIGIPAPVDKCGPVTESFGKVWAEESKKSSPSIIWACIKTFKWSYVASILHGIFNDVMLLVQPFAIVGITQYIADVQSTVPTNGTLETTADARVTFPSFLESGYVLCCVIFLAGVAQSLLGDNYSYFLCLLRTVNVRALLQLTIFKKALRLASWASKDTKNLSQGKMLNVMSSDTGQFCLMFYFIGFVGKSPVLIITSIVLLLINIGWPVLVGLFILVISFPMNGFLAGRMGNCQHRILSIKDRRLKAMNEMLLGMKSIKMYGWEPIFEKIIVSARKEETKVIRLQLLYRATFIFVVTLIPTFMACSIFVIFAEVTGPDNPLTTALAIKTLALLSILRFPIMLLPFAVGSFVSARACERRIIKFLNAPEVDISDEADVEEMSSEPNVIFENAGKEAGVEEAGVEEDGVEEVSSAVMFEHASFAWDNAPDAPALLKDLTVSIPRDKLTLVVGEVGAGKSALVNALIMEMHIQAGKMTRNIASNKISYASQIPWILNSSVKENILFGEALDQARYMTVCRACSLDMDFKTLPAGDNTEIGERGINLSGGQRQRVSVARAMYAYSRFVILDDPLSALDAHVGSKLFERGIKQFLMGSKRTVVLITHHLQYLKDADMIIELEQGKIRYTGDHTLYEEESVFYRQFLGNLASKAEEGDVATDIVGELTRERLLRRESERSLREHAKGQLMEKEDREKGAVTMGVYVAWARAAGWTLGLTLLTMLTSNVARAGAEFWITVWTEKAVNSWTEDTYYIVTYLVLALIEALLVFVGLIALVFNAMRASRRLFQGMLSRVLRATPRFFDVTPLGRIINRFSNDISNVDIQLMETMDTAFQRLSRVLCVLVVQVMASYYVGIAVIPIFIVYAIIQQIYITTTREIQRLDSICKSPIMALFSESLGGLSTIRAYLKVPVFISRIEKYIDEYSNSTILIHAASRWLGARIDFIAVLLTTTSGLVCVTAAQQVNSEGEYVISAATAGLALTLTMMIPGELNQMVRNLSRLEQHMTAVERINYYTKHVPVEPDHGTLEPARGWPHEGQIIFQNYFGAYDEGLDTVLKDITLTIPAGKRVGICGRTGSGKSSLTIALFRLLCCKGGYIKIDGTDITSLPLRKLRETLTIIPQDPLLFAGTLRYNLDPSQQVQDQDVWNALERVNMKDGIVALDKGLDTQISESGKNFSVGQRQLLCLARAFLRNSKIVVMDEATASIDLELDEKLQKVIRSEFVGRTLIVIAHRISSIADSDLIVVMDKGRVVEYDTPLSLSANPDSLFTGLLTSNVL